jgi:hypothetical protein
MGSFDATCVVSDIGISCGDRIACLLLQGSNYDDDPGSTANWNPVSPFLMGKYDDYGRIALDEEPKAFLDHLRPWIAPQVAGSNSCHEQAIDPDLLDWDGIQEADHEGRLMLFADDEQLEVGKKRAARRRAFLIESGGAALDEEDDGSDPFWRIRKLLAKAGIDPNSKFGTKDGVYVYGVGNAAGIYVVETPWDTKKDDPLVDRVREVLAADGLAVHLIPAPGRGYHPGTPPEDHQVGLLVTPALGTTTRHISFGGYEKPKQIRAARGFIRVDVLDALWPVNDRMLKRAGMLKKLHAEHAGEDGIYRRIGMGAYGFTQSMKQMGSRKYMDSDGLWFGSEGSTADEDHIAPQILAMPTDSPVEAYVPWVRLANVISTMKWWMRKGLRPTVQYVGSQCASEDWEKQLKYHRTMAKLLAPVVKEMKAERKRWE